MSPGRLDLLVAVAVRGANSLVLAGAARSASRTPESSPAATRESRPAGRPPSRRARPAPAPPRHRSMPASATHAVACSRMTGTRETPIAGAMSTAALAKELAGPGEVRSWAPGHPVHGESPRFVGWVDYTIEHVFGYRERCRR
jgi:hypothetical protein